MRFLTGGGGPKEQILKNRPQRPEKESGKGEARFREPLIKRKKRKNAPPPFPIFRLPTQWGGESGGGGGGVGGGGVGGGVRGGSDFLVFA